MDILTFFQWVLVKTSLRSDVCAMLAAWPSKMLDAELSRDDCPELILYIWTSSFQIVLDWSCAWEYLQTSSAAIWCVLEAGPQFKVVVYYNT